MLLRLVFMLYAEERGLLPVEHPIYQAGYALLDRIVQHQHAPRWNFETGDRVVARDLDAVEAFRDQVAMPPMASASPPFEIPADIRAAWDAREEGARREEEAAPRGGVHEGVDGEADREESGGYRADGRG